MPLEQSMLPSNGALYTKAKIDLASSVSCWNKSGLVLVIEEMDFIL